MILLPQVFPYTDLLSVLICGGSTPGGGFAIDNCVSMQPEAENATWVIERMVRKLILFVVSSKFPNDEYPVKTPRGSCDRLV